ncbi:MAG: flavin reductase family protein [Candidatus Aminicenantes bacterium]|nr:flavin reductase family protein [Candidatus Aminicenantes bacterium]TFG58444.1 MAG: flavin reductase family protein [Candidatus Aminicenantes bacterium]
MTKREFDLQGPDITKLSWFLSTSQAVMLTCCNAKRSINGIITVTWMTPTSHVPLLLMASVGSGGKETGDFAYRVCYSLINETKEFGLNISTRELTEAIGKVGTTHSDEVDKFGETGLTPFASKKISAPLISECFLNVECRVIQQFVTGDHTVFVAEPLAVYLNDDVFVDGKFTENYRDKRNQVHLGDFLTLWNMW